MASSDLGKIGREGFNLIDACKCNRRRLCQLHENPNNYYSNKKEEAHVGTTINHREAARKYQGINVEQRYYYKADQPKPPKPTKSRWSVFFQASKF